MSLQNTGKLQQLLQSWPQGTVGTAGWLDRSGISSQLRNKYLKSGWITSLGHSAYKKSEDRVQWQGGLYALQTQSGLPVHAGALTALSMQGMAHYLRLGTQTVYLFQPPNTTLPVWFRKNDWGVKLHPVSTSLLPQKLALTEHDEKTFSICISTPERALLECLHLAPKYLDLMECYQIMEGLTTLRPKLLQPLLEQCSSIKVKRIFCYMAAKAGHGWYKRLDINRLDLGNGVRTITKGGVHIPEFGLILPKELASL